VVNFHLCPFVLIRGSIYLFLFVANYSKYKNTPFKGILHLIYIIGKF